MSSASSSSSKTKPEITSDYCRKKLREHFKHKDFKSNLQKDAIKKILKGKGVSVTLDSLARKAFLIICCYFANV